jgi:type IV secretion system protein VirB11
MSEVMTEKPKKGPSNFEQKAIAEKWDTRYFLRRDLSILDEWLNDPEITEVCVNRPCELFFEKGGKWTKIEIPALDLEKCGALGRAIAQDNPNIGRFDSNAPIGSGTILDNLRIQLVHPPACESGTISITIRRPSARQLTLGNLAETGFFDQIIKNKDELSDVERNMLRLKEERKYQEFFRTAIQNKMTMVVCGETGSGKTTFMKAMVLEIPTDERLITIEDTRELFLPNHANRVHLLYSAEAKVFDTVNAQTLLKSCMRMRPDRILLAELRGAETLDFLNILLSGHAGTITSLHAGSPQQAFSRMAQLAAQNDAAGTMTQELIIDLLKSSIDIVVHQTRDKGYHITDIWYDPMAKRAMSRERNVQAIVDQLHERNVILKQKE